MFRLAGFTWGTLLGTIVTFAPFGLLFAVPQYVQEVLGTNAMGAGIWLLPMIGGLVVGTVLGERMMGVLGSRLTVAFGFAILAGGLVLGARTSVGSAFPYVAAWEAVLGLGTGFAMPATMDAALGVLTPERSDVASDGMTAIRMVGGAFGAAILGSILNSTYRNGLETTGVAPAAAAHARSSVVAGVVVAHKLHSPAPLRSVHTSFVHGMDVTICVSAGLAVVGVVLALVFLPRKENVSASSRCADFAHA